MREIDGKAIKHIAKNNIVVLRSAITGIAYNVSYTEDGLKYTTDKNGVSIYYSAPGERSDKVIVEKFIPRNHHNPALQAAEFFCIHKAYKLLYPVDAPYRRTDGVL